MTSLLVAHWTLGIYAVLLAMGGVMGFVKARSRPSLIAGLVSAASAVVALVLSTMQYQFGVPLGATLAIVLFLFFGYRYAKKNRLFMPNGLMAVVSFMVLAVMVVAMLRTEEREPVLVEPVSTTVPNL
jgi:uncharacterized membrane protein (UPF0136 family)